MIVKEKICAGWDGNSHPAFIWKNIMGKKYCQQCSYKVEGKKSSISQISEKQKEKNIVKKENTEILHNWFNTLWKKLPQNKYCTICNKTIYGDNLSIYWDHLVLKSKYPEFALEEDNIVFLCGACHAKRTNGFPHPKHQKLIDEAEKRFGISNK